MFFTKSSIILILISGLFLCTYAQELNPDNLNTLSLQEKLKRGIPEGSTTADIQAYRQHKGDPYNRYNQVELEENKKSKKEYIANSALRKYLETLKSQDNFIDPNDALNPLNNPSYDIEAFYRSQDLEIAKAKKQQDFIDAGFKESDVNEIKKNKDFWADIFNSVKASTEGVTGIPLIVALSTPSKNEISPELINKKSFFSEFIDALIFWD